MFFMTEPIEYETAERISNFLLSGHLYLYDNHQLTIPLIVEGIAYPSVRHAVIGQKALSIGEKVRIATTALPADLKDYERALSPPQYWDEQYVLNCLYLFTMVKFRRHPDLRKSLVATYPKELFNGFWKGEGRYDILHTIPVEQNYYGTILMEVRKQLL